MKICINSLPFYPAVGGLEQIALTLAIEFVRMGHAVVVLTETPCDHDNELNEGFNIVRTSSALQRYKVFSSVDVVLFMNFTFSSVPIAVLSGVPIVLSHHGTYPSIGNIKKRMVEFFKRQASRFFTNICVSKYVASKIPGNSVVILNAYRDDIFELNIIKPDRDFVFCGRLVSDKGCKVLLEAFKMAQTFSERGLTLTIIGDGPDKDELKLFAADNFPDGAVEFSGVLRGRSLAKKLQSHQCMVIPSLWNEPFGIVALEGIASCCSIISSNRGGLPEAIGDCGNLVEPTVVDLSREMLKIIKECGGNKFMEIDNIYKNKSNHLNKFVPKVVAEKYISVIGKMVQN